MTSLTAAHAFGRKGAVEIQLSGTEDDI